MFEHQGRMHQLQRFHIDGFCSQVHEIKPQNVFARIPPPDFIQIEWVPIQPDDSLSDVGVDVIESVATGDSEHRNRRRPTTC